MTISLYGLMSSPVSWMIVFALRLMLFAPGAPLPKPGHHRRQPTDKTLKR